MQPSVDRQAEFWNKRAAEYPAALADTHRKRLLDRLKHLPEEARPGPGRSCLDVGAGTGVYSIYGAELGARVIALDVSEEMLARLDASAAGLGIKTVLSDWRAIDPERRGWSGAFDIVFVQLVPSFRTPQDFARMEACCKGWCVYIGWGRKRVDPWLEAAFGAHGVPWAVPAGVPLALELLAELGRDVTPIWLPETWKRERTIEAAVRDAEAHLAVRDVPADQQRLEEMARALALDGRMVDAAEVEIGILCWRP